MNRQALRRAGARRTQRGDIMLVTMVFLLVCLLGLVGSMRDTITSTTLTGNTLTRQKDVQVADISVRNIEVQMANVAGGIPLQLSPGVLSQTWWRDTQGAAPPTAASWSTCATSSDVTQRCSQASVSIAGTPLLYTALTVVQYTGRSGPCKYNTAQTAMFYDIFTHVSEASGATSVNTETVYGLCS